MNNFDTPSAWAKVVEHIGNRLGETTISCWFDHAKLEEFTNERLVIRCNNSFICEIIQKRLSEYIEDAVLELFGMRPAIHILDPEISSNGG